MDEEHKIVLPPDHVKFEVTSVDNMPFGAGGDPEVLAWLLDRVDGLEKRVESLERKVMHNEAAC